MRICFFVLLAIVVIDNISLSQQKIYSDLRIKDKSFFLQDSVFRPEKEKSPALAGIMSFILPGLGIGQVINGQYVDFTIRLLITVTSVGLFASYPPSLNITGDAGGGEHSPVTVIAAIVFAANWLSSVVDAIVYANVENKRIRLKNYYLKKQHTFDLNFGYDNRGVSFKAAVNF